MSQDAPPVDASPIVGAGGVRRDHTAEIVRERGVRERRLERSPVYVLRALAGALLAVFGVVMLVVFDNAALGLRDDIINVQGSLPGWVATLADVAFGIATFIAILGTNIWLLVRRHWRRWVVINVAAVAGIVLSSLAGQLVLALATSDRLSHIVETVSQDQGLGNNGFASLVAVLTVAAPWINRKLRRWAGILVLGSLLVAALQGSLGIITLPMDLGVGILAGALVALALKTPNQTPTAHEVIEALERSGIDVAEIHPAEVDARGSVPWFATTAEGKPLFVKTLGLDNRAADLLFRLYRWVRLRHTGDQWPDATLRRAVEHEALVALAARSQGIRTPQLETVGEIGANGMLLAYERITARTLAGSGDGELSDEELRATWEAIAQLQEKGIAHRDLRLANIMIDEHGRIWIIDFGFAELAAHQDLLDRDIAEAMASTSAVIGPEGAVNAALEVVGADRVRASLPWIQPLALTSATRSQLGNSAICHALRDTAAAAVGGDEEELEKIERINLPTILMLATLGLAMYYLLPQLAGFGRLIDAAKTGQPVWMVAALVASVATYLGAAIAMIGSVPQQMQLWATFMAQVASSFSNRITPAKVGGMATNVRFLQKQGLAVAAAVSAVGLNTVTGFSVHISLLTLTGIAAGTGSAGLPLPSATTVTWVVIGLILLSGLFMVLPIGRRLLVKNLLPAIRAAATSVASVARRPTKLLALFTGSFIVTLGYALAMVASLRAFGDTTDVVLVVAVYLAGAAVATAAPTPGGLGATEAALIAGYTAIGIDSAVAISAVLLFRLVTFWLPILPGWLALHRLQRRGEL